MEFPVKILNLTDLFRLGKLRLVKVFLEGFGRVAPDAIKDKIDERSVMRENIVELVANDESVAEKDLRQTDRNRVERAIHSGDHTFIFAFYAWLGGFGARRRFAFILFGGALVIRICVGKTRKILLFFNIEDFDKFRIDPLGVFNFLHNAVFFKGHKRFVERRTEVG